MFDLNSTEHESVHFYSNEAVGLEAIIAVHSTYRGMSLGGCRIRKFSSRKTALNEVLRLSRHMTYKALLCDLQIGGGKSVILKKRGFRKTPQLLSAFANAVNSLNGQYIVSVDMGSDSEDMRFIRQKTDHVIGYDEKEGGAGDPGIFTARGILAGMRSAAVEKWASPSLKNRTCLVMGIGDVGLPLSRTLIESGAHLIVCDTSLEKLQKIKEYSDKIQVIGPNEIYSTKCDFFCPCALGDIFTAENAKDFQCQIIAGAANNQLHNDSAGVVLHQRGLLYLPDFAINAGGLIGVVTRGLQKKNEQMTFEKVDQIGNLIKNIIQTSKKRNEPTYKTALDMAHKKYKIQHLKTKIKRNSVC